MENDPRVKAEGKRCVCCGASLDHKLKRALYCSNRCKQEVKNDPNWPRCPDCGAPRPKDKRRLCRSLACDNRRLRERLAEASV